MQSALTRWNWVQIPVEPLYDLRAWKVKQRTFNPWSRIRFPVGSLKLKKNIDKSLKKIYINNMKNLQQQQQNVGEATQLV